MAWTFGCGPDGVLQKVAKQNAEQPPVIDRPDSPAGEAIKAFFGTLHGRTPEQRRRFRRRVLSVTLEDLQRVGETWLRPERASTAVVSDPQTVARVAPALGLEVRTL